MVSTRLVAGASTISERAFRLWLIVITAVGAAWRLGYLVIAKLGDPLLLNDSIYYSIQAGRNSEGDWFREALTDLPGAEHGPLTSLYLTPWSFGAGANVDWQRLATTLLGLATVAIVGLVGRRLAGPLAGLYAAGIAAVYPNLWINDSLIMSESLACLLGAVALLTAMRFDQRPSVWTAIALGALVGLGALTRSELGLYAIGFAALAWWRAAGHRRRMWVPVAVVVTAGAVMAPWALYNLTRFERPVLLTTNDGTTLLGANCDTTYFDDLGGWDIRCLEPVPTDESVDASIRSLRRRDLAFDYVTDNLERVPLVVAARIGRVVDLYGLESLVTLDVGEEKARWAVWAGIVCWWLAAVAAFVGWRALSRHGPGAAERARARWWFVVPLAAVLVTAALFYGAHRIRAPAEPAMVVLAGAGVASLIERRRRAESTPPSREPRTVAY